MLGQALKGAGTAAAVLVGQQESKATPRGLLPAHLRITPLIPGQLLPHVATSSVHREAHFRSQTASLPALHVFLFAQPDLLREIPT